MARILVVDDDPDIVEAMQDFLEEMGHDVVTSNDGTHGYQTALVCNADLIILDVDMPGKTGIQVCEELRKMHQTVLTPIVILTGFVDDETLMSGLDAGCDDFLNKPPNIPVLKARVNSLLRISQQRNQIISTNEDLDQKVMLLEAIQLDLQSALNEKEVLLKELYHRTKNNMQSITSLLNLQMYQTKDPELGKAFQVTQDRIASMALVHKMLYQSKSLDSIDLREYLIVLKDELIHSYTSDTTKIVTEVQCDNVAINLEKAIPAGLVVNEVLTNALKYAFPSGKGGKISILGKQLGGNLIQIRISDNGVGLPPGYDPYSRDSLGFKLIRIITQDQLEGKLEYHASSSGLTVSMKFSLD
ncbi:MAG: response regulator [Candidatus Marinimicrobia bacterium]|nr:response regulator [Candidatus Neomarinimicrobiota bacterium]